MPTFPKRWIRWLMAACLALCATAAFARSVLDLEGGQPTVPLLDWGDWVVTPGRATLDDVVARPAAFKPTLPAGTPYPLRDGDALWIRFAVPAAADGDRWF